MPALQEIVDLATQIRQDCDRLIKMTEPLRDQKEWLSTAEFAAMKGIKPQTVSNYCRLDHFKRIRKTKSGRYEIHISELEG